ncbi:hypothetical protein [Rhodanobacter umsongensis]
MVAHQQAVAGTQQGAAGQRLAIVAEHVHRVANQAGQRGVLSLCQQQALRDDPGIAAGEAECERFRVEKDRQVPDHHVMDTCRQGQRTLFADHRVTLVDVAVTGAGIQRGAVAAIKGDGGAIGCMCRRHAGAGGRTGEGKGGAM